MKGIKNLGDNEDREGDVQDLEAQEHLRAEQEQRVQARNILIAQYFDNNIRQRQ